MADFITEVTNKSSTTYQVKISYYVNGKRTYYTESFSTKTYGTKRIALQCAKECRDKMRKQLNIDGIVLTQDVYTPLEVLEMSFETFPISLETKRKQRIMFNKFIAPYVGDDFSKITPSDIQKTLNKMTSSSTDTINRVMSIWKRMYRMAQFKDIVVQDLTIKVFIPKSKKPRVKRTVSTSKEELDNACKEIMQRVKPNDNILIVSALYIMYYTGMRPSEVYALKRKNIDRDNRIINICQAIGSSEDENYIVINTKTDNSTRSIPYPKELDIIFDNLWNQEYLFKRKNGKFLNGKVVGDVLRRITNGTLRTYMLRHQFSTDMLQSNIDIRTIQEIMGHTSSTMTLEYARSDEETMKKALENRVKK